MITGMLQGQASKLKSGDIDRVVHNTDGYSGSDIRALCREAAMVPIRCWPLCFTHQTSFYGFIRLKRMSQTL